MTTADLTNPDETFADLPITASEILDRATALVPALRSRFLETERLGRLPETTISDVEQAGILRLVMPKSLAGAGASLREHSELIRILAKGDPTVAWTIGFLTGHNWMLARWPAELQAEIFQGRLFSKMSSVNLPPGAATSTDGGYILSGAWGYASCVLHADWVMVMGQADGGQEISLFLVPTDEVEIQDTWHVAGMKGTGSHDIRIDQVFVPSQRVMPFEAWTGRHSPGSQLHPEPMYGSDVRDVNVFVFPSLMVGGAEAVVELYRTRLEGRPATPFSPQLGADLVPSQMRYAKAVATVRVAAATLSSALGLAEEYNELDGPWTTDQRTGIKLDQISIVKLCLEAVDLVMAGSGGSVYRESDLSQHIFRDLHTASGHVSLNQDYMFAKAGENLLGRAPEQEPTRFFF